MTATRLDPNRLYRTLLALDGVDLFAIADLDLAALRKAKRLGYLRPARFAPNRSGRRPTIVAYAVTVRGRAFISAHEGYCERCSAKHEDRCLGT
jgi:hypothetical protein